MAITLAQARAYIAKYIDTNHNGKIDNWREGNAFSDWYAANAVARNNFDKQAAVKMNSIMNDVLVAMYSDPFSSDPDSFDGVEY